MDRYHFPCEPAANPGSTVSGPHYRFTLLDDRVFRYEWAEDGIFEDRASTFAINRKFSKPEFRVEDSEHELKVFTPAYQLTYDKQRFSPNGFAVSFNSRQTLWGSEWRYGTPATGNLGGTARTLDEADGRIDTGTGIISNAGYAVLDDSESMLFDGKGFVTTRRAGDRIDGYVFAYGYDFKGAMRSFYAISGKQPPVPRWSLGNWWSRYHCYDEVEYLAVMDRFKEKEIPMSVAVIDMDWHLVYPKNDIPITGWTGYTWDKELFPDPEGFAKALHDRGLKMTLNDHPHQGIHHHEDIYEEMARALGHDTTHKAPILFDPTSTEFMLAYMTILHRSLEKQGCDFWWIDWQQGGFTRIPGFDPLWLLNHFHYLDQCHVKDKSQSVIFSRYAGPGSHRYPLGFSGDTVATWASLAFQPEFTATASNIGYGWWSHDIGGHYGGVRDDELIVRWVQLGCFSPFLRLHSSNSRWASKEPWLYRSEGEAAMQAAMQLRHRLVPYIYSASLASSGDGLPLIQPLYWHFPRSDVAYHYPNQYYFGPSMVVSPIVSPRNPVTNLAKTKAWIPPGRHVDIFAGIVYDGDQEIDLYRPIGDVPVLAPAGSIIPLDAAAVPKNGCTNPEAFEVVIILGADGRFEVVEDEQDDEGHTSSNTGTRSFSINYNQSTGILTTSGAGRALTFTFIAAIIDLSSLKILVDGKSCSDAETQIRSHPWPTRSFVTVPKVSSDSKIEIHLGLDPQLAVVDSLQRINELILDFQISVHAKDDIYAAVNSERRASSKLATLLGLGLDADVLGPVAELLSADSRRP